MYNFFVLNFDKTYKNELKDSYGVEPSVFLVPDDEMLLVRKLARQAGKDFKEANFQDDRTIEDLFLDYLSQYHITFHYIGTIHMTFKERRVNYLVDEITRCIV